MLVVIPCLSLTSFLGNFTCEDALAYDNYVKYYQTVSNQLSVFYNIARLAFGLAGMIGGLLEIIVLTDKQFNTVSFLYHKSLVVFDLLYSVIVAFGRAFVLFLIVDVQLRSYVNDMIQAIADVSCYIDEIIVWAMTLDRFLAVCFPLQFYLYNTNCVAGSAIAVAIAIGTVLYAPEFAAVSLSITNETNTEITTNWGNSESFSDLEYYVCISELFVVYSCLAMSIGVAVGLKQKYWATRKGTDKLTKDEKAKRKLQISLSLLCLSCSVPIIFLESCYFVRHFYLKTNWDTSDQTYKQAMDNVTVALASGGVYVGQMLGGLVAHCVHFYLYCWLSPNFRKAVVERFCVRKPTKVLTVTTSKSVPTVKVVQATV